MGDLETNKDTARKVEAAWDEGRIDDLDQYFSPDFKTNSGLPGMPPTLASAKQAGPMATQAFPDRKVEIRDILAEGDKVFLRTRVTGTNKGGAFWFNAPEPNGKQIDFESWIVYRFRDGKIVEAWGINDGEEPCGPIESVLGRRPVAAEAGWSYDVAAASLRRSLEAEPQPVRVRLLVPQDRTP